ncbi:serine/threonine-protein phosphatase 7 long form [Cinnamomum micranthum f. kanehirae]|uniref:Serine/threonine-protein phosphatase 7 long form n=1 Tax=Cinnamomum micranthum f. kanehirae TaxID=337451 RepID=A0A3S3P732_9MAGN|nr:serine/threonine-protein phosphatase 7 long form [Cinnamomum micranthum f. kanehirae]
MAADLSTKEDILLFEQPQHISEAIWNGEERGNLRIIATPHNLSSWELTHRQQEYIRMCGLEQLSNIIRMTIDHPLITALVERWRPETNTFHLPCGEATITLEDVAYIYGLPIDGPAVTGKALYSTGDTAKLCKDLLQKMVPVPFQMPFDRADKAKKSLANYSISMKEIIAIWKTREKTVVRGKSDASPTHEDSYMMWYASVTRLRISPPLKEKVDDEPLTPTHAAKGVDEILIP